MLDVGVGVGVDADRRRIYYVVVVPLATGFKVDLHLDINPRRSQLSTTYSVKSTTTGFH
jgi:hypothetical protein